MQKIQLHTSIALPISKRKSLIVKNFVLSTFFKSLHKCIERFVSVCACSYKSFLDILVQIYLSWLMFRYELQEYLFEHIYFNQREKVVYSLWKIKKSIQKFLCMLVWNAFLTPVLTQCYFVNLYSIVAIISPHV